MTTVTRQRKTPPKEAWRAEAWAKLKADPVAFEKYQSEQWARRLMREFHITPEQWQAMYDAQEGKCGICRKVAGNGLGQRMAVDHDPACCPGWARSCGKCVRGLLCVNCNRNLGWLETNQPAIAAWLSR
jgi:hypothetical protein